MNDITWLSLHIERNKIRGVFEHSHNGMPSHSHDVEFEINIEDTRFSQYFEHE